MREMILLISKNQELAHSFVRDLEQEGFPVQISDDLKDIRTTIHRYPESRMIIVDLECLGSKAHDILKQIKEDPRIKYKPIICIIRKDLVLEQLIAFESGADDFIYFPYSTLELQLKMRTIQGLLELQSQLKEQENQIKTLHQTQKFLVTLSHYINNTLTPLYNLAQITDEKIPSESEKLKDSTTHATELIKRVLNALNNFVQTGEFKLVDKGIYRNLMIDIEEELEKSKLH
jgi:DNA-binding NtrC family response regulator